MPFDDVMARLPGALTAVATICRKSYLLGRQPASLRVSGNPAGGNIP